MRPEDAQIRIWQHQPAEYDLRKDPGRALLALAHKGDWKTIADSWHPQEDDAMLQFLRECLYQRSDESLTKREERPFLTRYGEVASFKRSQQRNMEFE